MEMGTGKSKVIVDNIAYLYDTGRIDTAIIVAPKGVYRNWINSELPTHMPDHVKYTTAVWTATPKKEEAQALEAIRFPSHDLRILVVNVEAFSTKRAVQWLDKFMLVSGKVFMCVDESTTIKNPNAARTKSLIKIGRQAQYRRILTGEPVTRSPMDLYSQCQFLDPALLGFSSYYSFRSRYAIMVDMKAGARSFKKVVGFQRLEELSDMIKSFSFRCKKDDCLDLPDKIYQYRYVEMTKEQKKAYNDVSKMAFTKIDGELLTADNVLTQMLRLHQITCGHVKTDEGKTIQLDSGRLAALMETLEETPDKVIIWANYLADIASITGAIGKEYGDESLVSYYGGTSDDDRQTAIKRFQEDPNCRFFIGNPQTGGMGITLTAANTVVYYSNSYNLEHRLQSEDRAHHIGQKNNVVYVDLVCSGTVDEKIVKALRAKKQGSHYPSRYRSCQSLRPSQLIQTQTVQQSDLQGS
jgi:SNF2 family DNA or RNA helicase